ncbi:MAG: SLBB domain-containing protein [Lachnospiraceae bacterium]|nr:SLBB domain-containing protein [Lachnospiraceae bacterium]
MELLSELGAIQAEYGFLPTGELKALSSKTGMHIGEILSAASFYSFFTLEPDAEDHIEKLYPCRKAGMLLIPKLPYEWTALENARKAPETIIEAVGEAGLLGRSGGGFPVARKWSVTKNASGREKYIVCNADEGELFTGKDRILIEKNPWAVVEGMAVCAEATGAKKGFIYLRGEYEDLAETLKKAVSEAPLDNRFDIEIYMGHGAYVCGDETALLNSLEGKRGETRLKPPYPGVSGYMGCPTVVNNVESFACVSAILNMGPDVFRSTGMPDYPGTKLYTVCGAVRSPGVYEYPSGISIGELLEAAGGAETPIQAVLVGGGSCKLAGPDCLDVVMTPGNCMAHGLSFGTGSVCFIGAEENLVGFVRGLTEFFMRESCGSCTPCRVGLRRLAELMKKFEAGKAWPEDLDRLGALACHIRDNSRCPLGQAAVTPVLSLIDRFPEVMQCL